jgi:hypothetical protein
MLRRVCSLVEVYRSLQVLAASIMRVIVALVMEAASREMIALMMKAASTSETSETSTRLYGAASLKISHLYTRCHENLISCLVVI